ncbi:MAG: ribose-phosphate pyrophosphokinase [Anaerolineae bacterium]
MSEHPLYLFSGSANRPLAEEVAQCLGLPLGACTTTRLPDSEIHVQVNQVVRGADVFIIQPCSAPVNEHLMELLLYVDAFRRASANSITAVMPYFPYARQERMTRGREAISAKVVSTILETLGVSRVIFVDVHAPAIQGFFNVPVDPLSAVPTLAEQFNNDRFHNAAIVAPDVGRAKLAGKYAEILKLPLALMHKRRDDFESAHTTHVVGDIRGKTPIVIDDLIASGSVLTQLPALVEAGARPEIHLAITHPVLLPTALKRLDDPLIAQLVVTNTIHVPPEKRHPKLKIVSIAPLLAEVIQRIHHGQSISSLLRLT